jgi:hypothetical protein
MSSRHKRVCPGAFAAPESGHEQETVHLAQEGLVLKRGGSLWERFSGGVGADDAWTVVSSASGHGNG